MHRILLLSVLVPALAHAQHDGSPPQPMRCETGPVTRTFGGAEWIVYSCEDEASLIIISAKGNPASPFVFYLSPKADSYRLGGEGNGDKAASDAAGAELSQLAPTEIEALLAETKAAASTRPSPE